MNATKLYSIVARSLSSSSSSRFFSAGPSELYLDISKQKINYVNNIFMVCLKINVGTLKTVEGLGV